MEYLMQYLASEINLSPSCIRKKVRNYFAFYTLTKEVANIPRK